MSTNKLNPLISLCPVERIAGLLRNSACRFSSDERGTVAMLFGLIAMGIVMFVGAAVDMGRWLHAYSQTKVAVDAAVLAGTRTLQVTGGDSAAALATARSFYRANVKSRTAVRDDKIDFTVDAAAKSVTVMGTAYIKTPFLGIAHIQRLALWKEGSAEAASTGTYSTGSSNGGDIEISIMLDTTGSMGGQKIADLKTAAKDLLDIVLAQGQDNVRVALAPFAEAVRPGSAYLQRVRGTPASSQRVRDLSGKTQTYTLTPCVSERIGSNAFTDAGPDSAAVGAVYTRSGSCTTASEIVPLTADKAKLAATIDRLAASGSTAGHVGSAWAWYLLSPRWASVWGSGSAPGSYDDTSVRKIAILMTDGEYNTEYDSKGIMTSSTGGAPVNGSSDTQARTMCGAMKEQGIEVYTVGFALDNAKAIETLRTCASSQATAYVAQDGTQLRNAFRDIAIKISPLRLTQ